MKVHNYNRGMNKDYLYINKILPYNAEDGDPGLNEKQEGKGDYNIIAMGTTFNGGDRHGDVIDSNAFNSSIKRINDGENLKILFSHNREQAIGNWTKAVKTAKGIKLFGRISEATDFTKNILALVRDGVYDKVSIGFIARDFDEMSDGIRILKGELVECSVVAIPANNNADILSVKDYDMMMSAAEEAESDVNHYNKDDGIEFNNFIKRLEGQIFTNNGDK